MNPQNNMIFCTLFDSNYLDKGLALYQSMKRHMEEFKLYIVAFDDRCYEVLSDMCLENIIPISLKEIMNNRLEKIKEERSRAEFCWTCTPVVIEYVLITYQEKVCTYIDADIYFFSSPENALQEITNRGCSVGVTPHGFERNYASIEPMFNHGKYCIQFNTFFNNKDGLLVLNDWKEACLDWCYNRYEDGKFGDQRYVEIWKQKYSCVYESQNPGLGVAPWNLHLFSYAGREKGRIWLQYGKTRVPLIFYHFEGMKYLDDGSVFLNLWKYDSMNSGRKIKEIYGKYFEELRVIRQYLKLSYEINFEHMKIDTNIFLPQYSLKWFCKDRGLLGGLKTWIGFRKNDLMKEL